MPVVEVVFVRLTGIRVAESAAGLQWIRFCIGKYARSRAIQLYIDMCVRSSVCLSVCLFNQHFAVGYAFDRMLSAFHLQLELCSGLGCWGITNQMTSYKYVDTYKHI